MNQNIEQHRLRPILVDFDNFGKFRFFEKPVILMQFYKITNKCKSIEDETMKLGTHNSDHVCYFIPKIQPIKAKTVQDVIIQSAWS